MYFFLYRKQRQTKKIVQVCYFIYLWVFIFSDTLFRIKWMTMNIENKITFIPYWPSVQSLNFYFAINYDIKYLPLKKLVFRQKFSMFFVCLKKCVCYYIQRFPATGFCWMNDAMISSIRSLITMIFSAMTNACSLGVSNYYFYSCIGGTITRKINGTPKGGGGGRYQRGVPSPVK